MIDGMGLEAIEQMMTLAQIKREEAKAMEYSDDPASLAPKEEKKNASKDFNFKRCKMCGNVCNVRMMSCSSCCLSLADASSFTPVYNLPKVASGENGDGMEENDDEDDDDKDAYASSSSDDDDEEDNDEMMRQVLPSVAATSEKQKKSLEALARRRNERQQQQQQHQPITNEVKSKDAASSSLWWWQTDPMFAPYLGGAPEHKRGYDPSLQSAYDELKIPLGSGESRVRDAYLNQIMARHPDAAGSKKKLLKAQQAYETIAKDFWRHDSGCASMRKKIDQALKNTTTETQSYDPTKRTIFVSLRVYRDLEAQHTLRSLFKMPRTHRACSSAFVGNTKRKRPQKSLRKPANANGASAACTTRSIA